MPWTELSEQQQPADQQPDLTPLPLPGDSQQSAQPAPSEEPATPAQPATEAPSEAAAPTGWQEPAPAAAADPAPQEEATGANPFGEHGLEVSTGAPETPQQRLEAAIDSGDKYAVVQALSAMGVNMTDERLSQFLLPPGQPSSPS